MFLPSFNTAQDNLLTLKTSQCIGVSLFPLSAVVENIKEERAAVGNAQWHMPWSEQRKSWALVDAAAFGRKEHEQPPVH